MVSLHPSTAMASSSSHKSGEESSEKENQRNAKDERNDDEEGEEEVEQELDEHERARQEAESRRTTALRIEYELRELGHVEPLVLQYLDDEDEETFSELPTSLELPSEENDGSRGKAWDDTSSMSSGMGWFQESPPESEFGDDDAMSFHSSCESENKDDEAIVTPNYEPDSENEKQEDASLAAKLDNKSKLVPDQVDTTCYFMKAPPEVRCLIYQYCFPPKHKSLICMWPAESRTHCYTTPVTHEEPTDNQLPSFSSNLQKYPLDGPRAAPIKRKRNFIGQSILAVNRLIYQEASQDFYKSHTFRFNSRQIDNHKMCSGLFRRLRSIEIEDAVFRFGLKSTERMLVRLSRNPVLERIVVGPRVAESLFSVVRRHNPVARLDAYGPETEEIKPYAANMYNAEYFKTQLLPSLPKVVVVSLNIDSLEGEEKIVDLRGFFRDNQPQPEPVYIGDSLRQLYRMDPLGIL